MVSSVFGLILFFTEAKYHVIFNKQSKLFP